MTRHWQWGQTGASAWIAHSKLSNVCRFPATVSSNDLSYSFSQTSHLAILNNVSRAGVFAAVSDLLSQAMLAPEVGEMNQGVADCAIFRPFHLYQILRRIGRVEIALESDNLHGRLLMEIPKRLIDCLNENKVRYEILHHSEAVTAQRIAQAEHVKARHHAKVVMIKSGGEHLMAALPADHQIDLEKFAKAIGKAAALAAEAEFKPLFPDCAIGAMPPFGSLYGLPTYVDKRLAEEDYIVFEAGTHTDAIKMSYRDYEKIVQPRVEDLAVKIQPMKGA